MPFLPRLALLLPLLFPLAAHGADDCRLDLPDVEKGDDMRWQGPCKDGYAHGIGVIERHDDKLKPWRYEGMVERGRPQGKGYLTAYPGIEYDGEFRDGLKDGSGVWVNAFGDHYKGQWKAGKREGKGAIVYTLGGRYDGEWSNDRPNGKGVAVYSSGRRVGAASAAQPTPAPAAGPSAAVTPPPQADYDLKADRPKLGTHIPHKIITGGVVPFGASYEQLNDAERTLVRKWYPLLDPADEPPYPLRGQGNVLRTIQAINAKDPAVGMLSMVVMVDKDGNAESVNVYVTPDAKLSELASFVAMKEKFKPASCSGKPCAMGFPYSLMFTRTW